MEINIQTLQATLSLKTPSIEVWGGPLRGGYCSSVDADNDFILNNHTLAKLRKELNNQANLKTSSNHKKSTHEQIMKHGKQTEAAIQRCS